jgi:hypothetical protein
MGRESYDDAVPLYSRAVAVVRDAGIARQKEPAAILGNALQLFQMLGDAEKAAEVMKLLGISPPPAE